MRRATVVSGPDDASLLSSARASIGNSNRGRIGGLFSSSSSSSGDSDAPNDKYDSKERVGAVPPLLGTSARNCLAPSLSNSFSSGDFRRRTMFSTSATSLVSSTANNDGSGHSTERKGLFEADDDAGDSLERFHERVKLRQSKTQSELKALKAQLETAHQRAEELETKLSLVDKEKEECVIRTKECQRIIEKRNKQLMKASEKMARHSEQYELQIVDFQTKLATVTSQCDQLRADAIATDEINRRKRELKDQERLRDIEVLSSKHEAMLAATEARIQDQQAENAGLVEKLRQVEQQLVETAHQQPSAVHIVASDEYQRLVKRCEDAEAVCRGLKFQLAKEQHEKKYLRKQLTALQEVVGTKVAATTAASIGFLPDVLLEPNDDAANSRDSVATINAEAELASFDFTSDDKSALCTPIIAPAPVLLDVSSPISDSMSSTRSQNRSRGLSTSSCGDSGPKLPMRDRKRRAASVQMLKTTLDPLDRPVEDKPAVANGKSSVTFFGKLSSRFKRNSSPRNVLDTAKDEDDNVDERATGGSEFTSALAQRQKLAHSKVLKERPRMYVAKSPSEDESSDSIFGSESSISDSSDEEMPPLPPPPPISMHDASVPIASSVHLEMPSQQDAPTDADASSSGESDNSDEEEDEWRDAFDEPTQLPTLFVAPFEKLDQLNVPAVPSRVRKASVASASLSPSSDDDSDDFKVEKSQPLNVSALKSDSSSEISSSSDSSYSDCTVRTKKEVLRKVRKASGVGQDRHDKQFSCSPPSLRGFDKSKNQNGGDNLHSSSKSRMNEYMEDRARKRNEKLKRKQKQENEETKKKEEYEKEWEQMAQEERERKRKQQKARRNGKRRPASMKTVRVSQMRHQMNSKQYKEQRDSQTFSPSFFHHPPRPHGNEATDVDGQSRHHPRRKSESKTSGSEVEEERTTSSEMPPLPPEPTLADTELYLRQQARLRERHEMQMKKKLEADEADAVRGEIHRRVEMWAFGKELLHLILTLDQITSNEALKKCQLMVVQSPDVDTVRKAYRNIIRVVHPDKLRGATVSEQLEAKELFTVLNQSFEKFKNQHN